MKTPNVFLLFIFFLIHLKGYNSFAQTGFMQVPPPNGSWGGPMVGTQDPSGYMWFGSVGLHRYDGYNYKSYFNDPLDSTSLALNKIESIHADRKGIVWVGTNGGGLDRLDPETGIFTHFRHDTSDPASISHDWISAILEDRDGNIWVGTEGGGLNCLDPKTATITHFSHSSNDINSLSNDEVRVLYEDHHGTLWIGTGFPFTGNSKWKAGGLNRFNQATKNFTRYLHNPDDPFSLSDNRVRAIFEDSKGRFWIGTAGDGLHTMNREQGSFERYKFNAAYPNRLSRPPIRNTISWLDDMISFINEDATGNIWIGTLTGGLNRYNPESRSISHYATLQESSTNKIKIDNFWWSYTSKDSVLWIAAWRLLYRLNPLHEPIPHSDIGRPVRSLLQDSKGNLWLGTHQGLVVFESNRINKKTFIHDVSDSMSLSFNTVNSIFEDQKSTIWVGTDKGLNRYSHLSQKFTRFLDNELITVIYEDRQGTLWCGTSRGVGILNKQADSLIYYLPDTTNMRQNEISVIHEDKAGQLWIGTANGGLNRFDQRSKKFHKYLPGTYIYSIFEDADFILWIGTNRGIYYFNSSSNSFLPFINASTAFTGSIVVYNILEDNQQSLWMNTGIGLFRLSHNRKEISFFGKNHGIIPPTHATQKNCFKGKGGELFFGDNLGNGYYSFFPEQIKGNATPPDLHITGFRLGDQLVVPGKGSALNEPISQTKQIRLSYYENIFSFDFAGIHYSNPTDNRHLFMLENLDNVWRKTGEEKTAYYYNVPPGKYIFRIKASSSDGVWAEKSIAVIIYPPWWKTWWAYSIYGIMLIVSVFGVHSIQKKRVIKVEREKTRERELAQAKEIEKAYTELKTTQTQLIHAGKMASLGELTAGIAHEIQNPLNFVNNFSEINKELIGDLKVERLKLKGDRNEELEAQIIKDIEQNEEKIIQHGKRADIIVKGMLQHSRSTSDKKELTDINALCGDYIRLAYHGLKAKDPSFQANYETHFDPDIPRINVIPQDLGRAILNIINNAFQAVAERSYQIVSSADERSRQGVSSKTPPVFGVHQPTVILSTFKEKNKVIIKISDNGPGIPDDIKDKIFQPFFTTKPTGQGTGLGLSLAYDIITKGHGGTIVVNSFNGPPGGTIVINSFNGPPNGTLEVKSPTAEEGTEFIIALPIQ